MKKYIIMAVSALMLAFTSCTDSEDIEIVKYNDVTFEINTRSVYEDFTRADYPYADVIKDIIRDKLHALQVTSLIYDANGAFVDSVTTNSFDMNIVRHNYNNLQYGQYTVVFIETLVSSENNFKSFFYELIGVDKLSTLEIKQIYPPAWYAAIGVSSHKITVGDELTVEQGEDGTQNQLSDNKTLQVVPRTLGSIINFSLINFQEAEYGRVAIGTTEPLSIYRLDPSIPEENRYTTTLSGSEYFTSLTITKVENNEEFLPLYVLGKSLKFNLFWQTEEAIADSTNNTYTSYPALEREVKLSAKEITYAGYAYAGDVVPPHTYYGDKEGLKEWKDSISSLGDTGQTGDPIVGLLPDLYMTWGGTVSDVQAYMKDYTMTQGSAGKADKLNEGLYAIAYNGMGRESNIIYSFSEETTGLFEIDVQYTKESVTYDEITQYLSDNYVLLASNEQTKMYRSKDNKTYVLLFEVNGMWNIGFVDTDYLSNMSTKVKIPQYRPAEYKVKCTVSSVLQEADAFIKYIEMK